MTRPLVAIYDAVTKELETREMNDTEFAQYEIDKAAFDAAEAARNAE